MLVFKVLNSDPADWFGRPLRQLHDADIERWCACVRVAQALYRQVQHGL